MTQEKINIAELIKDCPKGMELDCTIYNGKVCFEGIDDNNPAKPIIKISVNLVHIELLDMWGQYSTRDYSKCVIFPKGKNTWEGFIPPCKFNDGDILYAIDEGNEFIFILKHINEHGRVYCYLSLKGDDLRLQEVWLTDYNPTHRLATEEEKQKLFQAIKDNGYKWNAETKTLEKLVEPKFKVGNTIQDVDGYKVEIAKVDIDEECYEYISTIAKGIGSISFELQDEWELVPNKFDISTLVPFESKVLVRDGNTDKWKPNFWGFYNGNNKRDYPYECFGTRFAQCIPYEGNEHLLSKTDDCEDYYKTWE